MAPLELSSHKVKTLFQDVLECYEHKQLSKGRKVADRILRSNPNHAGKNFCSAISHLSSDCNPETLCMKGLFLLHLGDRETGKELVRQGVQLGRNSHICWHVLALVQRGERMYEDALESYTNALRCDKVRHHLLPFIYMITRA